MRYLTLGEVLRLHQLLIESSGGAPGVSNLGLLDSALAQPRATFDGRDLHPTVLDKAAALCASLVQNHPFVDGNKRVGHAAMATFLLLKGLDIVATTDEQEQLMLESRRRALPSRGCCRLAPEPHEETRFRFCGLTSRDEPRRARSQGRRRLHRGVSQPYSYFSAITHSGLGCPYCRYTAPTSNASSGVP